MPVLTNARYEQFAVNIANGDTGTQAVVKAGYSANGADVTAVRLLRNPSIEARVLEIRTALTRSQIHHQIADRSIRIGDYNLIRLKLLKVIEERAAHADYAEAPGGKTGVLVKTYKQIGSGRDAQLVEEFAVDTGLLNELNATNRQASQELGQWTEKRELSGSLGLTVSTLDSFLDDGGVIDVAPIGIEASDIVDSEMNA